MIELINSPWPIQKESVTQLIEIEVEGSADWFLSPTQVLVGNSCQAPNITPFLVKALYSWTSTISMQ
jgi:hypothetical protein